MEYSLTSEQETHRERARAFADTVVKPGAGDRDAKKLFPRDIVKAAAAQGYMGLLVPTAFGGAGLDNVRQCLILEEIARADASAHVTISVHNSLVCGPTNKYASDVLKRKYLPQLARGEMIGAYALTEPHAGSDAAALSCTAVRDGDAWVMNGSKMWITTGGEAGLILVFARTDKSAQKAKGISAFLVDRHSPGLTVGKPENKLGIRASETVQLFFENVRIPGENLVGELNRGFNYAMETLNGGRIGIATQAVGIAQAILDEVVLALRGRKRDGVAVRTTQDEDFRVAEMATKVTAARHLVRHAAQLRDRNQEHVREASMAKLFASQAANEMARMAVELLGPEGYRDDLPIARLFRDARITEIYEGTTEVQKLVIARTYLRD